MDSFARKIKALSPDAFSLDEIHIRIIQNDEDLWYATAECQLAPGQDAFVNPAGFSIGRAYLHPESNVPCIILKGDIPIGYIVLRKWYDGSAASWSYYLDKRHQGKGYGTTAAQLAVQILKKAYPNQSVKLSAEAQNTKAHRLYQKIGFHLSGEIDGDDLVFIHE